MGANPVLPPPVPTPSSQPQLYLNFSETVKQNRYGYMTAGLTSYRVTELQSYRVTELERKGFPHSDWMPGCMQEGWQNIPIMTQKIHLR